MKSGGKYLQDRIIEIIRLGYERIGKGMADQVDVPAPKLVNCDPEKIDRISHSLTSWPPGTRSDQISMGMITVSKGQLTITPETLEHLKQRFTIYDTGKEVSQFIE